MAARRASAIAAVAAAAAAVGAVVVWTVAMCMRRWSMMERKLLMTLPRSKVRVTT